MALEDDCHKTPIDMLADTPVEFNDSETLAKSFVFPARQNKCIQENFFDNC